MTLHHLPIVPTLHVVETSPAARTGPRNYGGVVYLNGVRVEAERVEALIAFHQRLATDTKDWRAFDAWCAARDGADEPPPSAA